MFSGALRRTGCRTSLYINLNRWSTAAASEQLQDTNATQLANAKPFNQIPGYRRFPLIGSAWIYFPFVGKYERSKLHISDSDKNKKFGDVMREKFGPLDLVSCYRPELFEQVFRVEGKYPNRPELTTLEAYRNLRKEWYNTPGLLVLHDKEWQALRSKVQAPIMRPKIILEYLKLMNDVSAQLVDKIRVMRDGNNEVEDLMPELYKWALENVAFVGLDTRLNCLAPNTDSSSESTQLIKAVNVMFDCMNAMESFSGGLPFWKYFSTPTWRKFVKSSDLYSRTAMKYINRSLEAIKNDKSEDKNLTLLQSLLLTPGLDLSGAMTTVMDMLMAGIDTTSHTEAFLLYRLAINPEKQEKLYQEIKRVLPNPNSELNAAAINELRYLKAVIKEGIRMDPVVRGTARRLDHDIVLDGYRVPAGVPIFFMVQALFRTEKYFKNANQFIPERWLDTENKPHPFLYVPFGFGTRSCLGRRIAEQELISATTEIIRNFRIEYHYEEIGMCTKLVNTPDKPLKLKFIERK